MAKTLTLAAALSLIASAALAYDCNWSKTNTVAEAPMSEMTHKMEVAEAAPVDAWLIKYLDNWEKA